MASKDTAAIRVGDESWMFYTEEGRLRLYKSETVNETRSPDYELVNIKLNGRAVDVDRNTPISAVSWKAEDDSDTFVRVYYTIGGRLKELAWDKSKDKWEEGLLSDKTYVLLNGTGVSASVQEGQLKVYGIEAGTPDRFTVFYIVLSRKDREGVDWSSRTFR